MIYLDNAATTYPKPQSVLEQTAGAVFAPLGNPGRSGHLLSERAGSLLFSARESVGRLLGLEADRIVFTSGATAALNMAIFGIIFAERMKKVPLVYTDVFEHNSVLRPLFALEKIGRIRLFIGSPRRDGNLSREEILSLSPDVFVFTCRSNVTGHSFHLQNVIEILRKKGTVVIADAAQSLGCGVCTMESTGAHILCASGHKGLLGIMGGGVMAVSPDCPLLPLPILLGGSGTESFSPHMPELLPERLEAGTLPLPAIVSMGAGAEFLLREGVESIQERERELKRHLVDGIASLSKYVLYEPHVPDGPLLINHKEKSPAEVEKLLSDRGIMVRSGYHCAPLAHRFLGTEETGGVRLSVGPFNTKNQMNEVLWTLSRI